MQSSVEWDTVEVGSPILQGDVLISRDPVSLDVTAIRFVLTADCDIDKKKFGRHIACLHIEPLKVYLRTVWSGKQFDGLIINQRRDCQARIMKWIRKLNSDAEDMSYEAMDRWISSTSVDEICSEIGVPEKEEKKFKKQTAVYQFILNMLINEERDMFDKLCLCEEQAKGGDIKIIKKDLWKKACSDKLPDDVFIISEIPELDDLKQKGSVPLSSQ